MKCQNKDLNEFQKMVWDFYRKQGRHDLAWRNTTDPYHIFVSEIMLQQTQVSRVAQKYPEFLKQFPTFGELAKAPTSNVIISWQGMGYNRRAIYLQRSAQIICDQYHGALPQEPEILEQLPGIGPNTAGSISCFAYNKPTIFIETNIRRVFIHHFFPEHDKVPDKELLPLIEQTVDSLDPRQWYYALMDYGSGLKSILGNNPNVKSRHYIKQSAFAGSDRQVRAKIISLLTEKQKQTISQIYELIEELRPDWLKDKKDKIIQGLVKDGLLVIRNQDIQLA